MRNEVDVLGALREEAEQNLAVLEMADAYLQMLQTPGWHLFDKLQTEWLNAKRKEARQQGSANNGQAIYAWQAAEDLLEQQALHINRIIDDAHKMRGKLPLEVALAMEKVKHEHRESGTTENPTGY